MSKKKEKIKSNDAPIDYQLATKNLQYTIVIKDTDIERLKEECKDKKEYIIQLEDEVTNLRKNAVNAFELEKQLRKVLAKNERLEKEVDNFNNRLLEQRKKFDEEKKLLESTYNSQINHLRVTMDAYVEKVKMTNQLLIDKEKLEADLQQALDKNKEIITKNNEEMRKMIVRNEIKFSNLKNKMTENILQTKSKVTELNIQYMDVSSKLTLLQNHQLLIQLEYQSQQLDDLKEKNKKLEKEVYDLTKEVEIHKEVELENENNYNNEEDKDNFNIYRKTISFNNMKYNNRSNFTNNSILNSNIFNNGSLNINNEKSRIIKLEKKLLNLEKQLVTTKKEYNDLKGKNEYIENVLKNYENKYTGLFNFLEECLKKFFDDEQLKKNKEIYINIDSIHKGDFSALNKEEKYSTLIILMKHLMPLMNSKNISYKQNSIDNISLKFHEINAPKVQKSVSVRKSKKIKKYIMNTTNNFYNGSKKISRILNNKNELESLPSIRKVELSGSQLIRSKILNKQ